MMPAAGMLLLAAVTLAGAQFRSRVESVRVDALVTVNGTAVTGLTAADFEIRDEGVRQQVRLIGTASANVDVILALDMSGSLSEARVQDLQRGGDALLAALRPEDRAALLTFSHAVSRREPLTADTARLRAALRTSSPAGGTALLDAMFAGIAMAEPGDRRALLIVFTDGIDTASWLTADAVVAAARRADVVIYAVSTARLAQTPQTVRDVVAASGGQVLEVGSGGLDRAFVRILEEFRQRYLLSFTHARMPAPGWHRLEVRVKRPGAVVKARAGYLVGSR